MSLQSNLNNKILTSKENGELLDFLLPETISASKILHAEKYYKNNYNHSIKTNLQQYLEGH